MVLQPLLPNHGKVLLLYICTVVLSSLPFYTTLLLLLLLILLFLFLFLFIILFHHLQISPSYPFSSSTTSFLFSFLLFLRPPPYRNNSTALLQTQPSRGQRPTECLRPPLSCWQRLSSLHHLPRHRGRLSASREKDISLRRFANLLHITTVELPKTRQSTSTKFWNTVKKLSSPQNFRLFYVHYTIS